jgi:hypothetical protein
MLGLMTERLSESKVEHLALADLKADDLLRITTGSGEEAYQYNFFVEQAGQWPTGLLEEVKPDGSRSEPLRFTLQGAGSWTDRHQNPVQTQQTAFTSYFVSIYIGGFMVGSDPSDSTVNRIIFDKPGQGITGIELNPVPIP